jgi:hypothetical protein
MGEHLPGKHKALSSNPSIAKNKRKQQKLHTTFIDQLNVI